MFFLIFFIFHSNIHVFKAKKDMSAGKKRARQYPQGMTAFPPPGPAYLTGYAPMQYDRNGMTAALGRRFDESYGNNGNYEIYEISAPPKLAVRVKKRAVSTRG